MIEIGTSNQFSISLAGSFFSLLLFLAVSSVGGINYTMEKLISLRKIRQASNIFPLFYFDNSISSESVNHDHYCFVELKSNSNFRGIAVDVDSSNEGKKNEILFHRSCYAKFRFGPCLVDNRNRQSTECKHGKIYELKHFQCHKCLEIEIQSLGHEINSMSLAISSRKKQ